MNHKNYVNPGSSAYHNDISQALYENEFQAGTNNNDQGIHDETVNSKPPNPPLPKKFPPSNLDYELSRAAHQMNIEQPENKVRTQGSDLLQQRLSGGSNLDLMKISGLPSEQLINLRNDLSHNDSIRSFSIGGLPRKPQKLACIQNRSLLPFCPWCTKYTIYTLGIILISILACFLIIKFVLYTLVYISISVIESLLNYKNASNITTIVLQIVSKSIYNATFGMTDEIKFVLFMIIVTIVGIFVSLIYRLQICLYMCAICQLLIGLVVFTQIRRINYLNVESITEQALHNTFSQFQYENCDYCRNGYGVHNLSDVIGSTMMIMKCCGVKSYTEFYSKDEPPQMCCIKHDKCKKKSDELYPGCYDMILNMLEFNYTLIYRGKIDLTRFSLLAAGYIYTTIYVAISIIVIVNGVKFINDVTI